MDPSKSVQKPDVPTDNVPHVLHNALLVKIPLITVPFVSKEELTHQSVTALKVNTLITTEFAKTVTSNVKLALLMTNVLNVLKNLTEPPQPIVLVKMDTMKLTKLNAHLVMLNVLPVLLTTNVLFALSTEKTHQTVHVYITCMKIMEFVNHVLINVMDVKTLKTNVIDVLKTESMLQPVTVHKDIGMMVSPPNVVNVTVPVLPVNLTPTNV